MLLQPARLIHRAKPWIESEQMGAFLSVAKGSDEPPVFLEVHYNGNPDSTQAPLVLVGKGVTFDRWACFTKRLVRVKVSIDSLFLLVTLVLSRTSVVESQ